MPQNLDLSLIVAMTPERVIGRGNKLPWRLPSDLARFSKITREQRTVIMGYETYRSILDHNKGKPLPQRHHIVLTRRHPFAAEEQVESVPSLEAACEAAMSHGTQACVIGGAQIYKLFMPLVKTAFITIVSGVVIGDACFPKMRAGWETVSSSETKKWNPEDEYQTSYEVLRRIHS